MNITPDEITTILEVAGAAAHQYASRWNWIQLDELKQAAAAACFIALAGKCAADRAAIPRSYLFTVAMRAVRGELTLRTNPVGGTRTRYRASVEPGAFDAHNGPTLHPLSRLHGNGTVIQRGIGRLGTDNHGIEVADIDGAEHIEAGLLSLRGLVEATVRRVAPGTAADVLPAVVDVLAGECEIDEAADTYQLDNKRLSWAVRRVRAHLKADAAIREAVGKQPLATGAALGAAEMVPA